MSDAELVGRLKELLGEERRLTAAVLVHLGEVEARRLHLAAACSSMFTYCTRVLGMSEDQAFKRIRAARAVAPHLADDNAEALVAEASGRSKAEIEVLLARRAPRVDAPPRLEPLAAQTALVLEATGPAAAGAPGPPGREVARAAAREAWRGCGSFAARTISTRPTGSSDERRSRPGGARDGRRYGRLPEAVGRDRE